jgi:glycosyltransferase involved in cell wall biosynthesis
MAVNGGNVFLLTNFSTFLRSFSPIIVVGEQIKMLKRNGYNPILVACEGWDPPEDTVFFDTETKLIYPAALHDPKARAEDVEEVVDLIYQQLNDLFPDKSTVITHDLIFLPDYTVMNLAARRLAQNRPSLHWLHWIHSATNPRQVSIERNMYGEKYAEALNSPFPNSIICYPNAYDIPRVARNFNFEEDYVIEVPHSTDPTEGMHPLVQRLYDDKKLGDAEVLMIMPVRLDRGKYVEANVRLIAACKQLGVSRPRLVVCDFQSTGDDKVVYREDLKRLAESLDAADCVTFLSEFDDLASMEVSHDIILDLFTLSNVFVLGSKSETYSLIAQEAMLKGNFSILNQDFAPFRQIYGKNALYKQFDGSNIAISGYNGEIHTEYENINAYYLDMAKALKYYLANDKVLAAKTWVRTQRNPDKVFTEFVEPLLMVGNDATDN